MTLEAVPAIITQITLDVAECVDAAWAVAMSRLGSGLLPLYTFGQHPDLERCVAHTGLVLSEQLPSADESSARGRSSSENWAPRIICPIRVRGESLQYWRSVPRTAATSIPPEDRDLIASIAVHISLMMSDERLAATIGMKIAQLHRTKLELDSARQVQDRLYPWRLPPIRGLNYYDVCRPTGEVGGDFFDFVALDNSSLLVSIGDVSGKGVPAAIIMAGVLASLRALGVSSCGNISDLVRDLNRMVWEVSPDNFYAAMFYAHIDGPRHELQYVNAGHDRVILLRDDLTRAVDLESTGNRARFEHEGRI